MQNNFYFLRLTRVVNSENGTSGILELFVSKKNFISLVYSCQTLEPVDPSLPVGQYILKFTHSPKFSYKEPYIKCNNSKVPIVSSFLNGLSVENRGIRIHCGNSVNDTNGCILVGRYPSPDSFNLIDSRITYSALMSFLKDGQNELLLTIIDATLHF